MKTVHARRALTTALALTLTTGFLSFAPYVHQEAEAATYQTYFNDRLSPVQVRASSAGTISGGRAEGQGYGDGPFVVVIETVNASNSRIKYGEGRGSSGSGFIYTGHAAVSNAISRCWYWDPAGNFNSPLYSQGVRCDAFR